jgi:putative hydrolase of the HAD superfamily
MTKAVLFDIDGVLLPKTELFSERYAEEHGVDLEDIKPFFETKFRECIVGKADLKESLKPYLEIWNWEGSVDDFLDYWFFDGFEVDEDLMKLVDKLREVGIDCHLASNQEHYRSEYLLEELRFADYFDESFFSCDLGVTKRDKAFFEKVIAILNIDPNEIMYFDDDEVNILTAASVGIHAVVYKDIDTIRQAIKPLVAN